MRRDRLSCRRLQTDTRVIVTAPNRVFLSLGRLCPLCSRIGPPGSPTTRRLRATGPRSPPAKTGRWSLLPASAVATGCSTGRMVNSATTPVASSPTPAARLSASRRRSRCRRPRGTLRSQHRQLQRCLRQHRSPPRPDRPRRPDGLV